ncbi:MAG: heme ABC exporter ATP-binding protein CcmA [Sporanaerobacter sp.]|jgi:ABC transport system ATP-binding/permease protein|uniref:ABC-F family ATP-binding cassette domain-containing protein n=1 Tax=Sporanaerobacter sp. TaxID=2010183 RepID=UPI003A10234E
MNLLNVENISKSYNEKRLFKNISLGINEGDKIGLIGINGTGKTTLLKIIAGMEEADEGEVVKGSLVRIEYLPQKIFFDSNATVEEQVFKGNSKNMILIRQYHEAISNPNTSSEELLNLTNEMDAMNLWNLENEAKAVLTKLGISDFKAKVECLSGGEKKRIALASALINPSELLVLDEPTNHLDNDTIEWLEEYLAKKKGALLMITHDRYFLDMVVNKIIELDKGNLYSYEGNYNNYLEKKLEREEMEVASEKKRRSLLRKELAWMKQGAKARSTKQKARIGRFNELNEKVVDLTDEKLEISVGSRRLGKKVIEIDHISKSFDDKKVIDDFDYILLKNDRIGILGPNGSGKSTLINIMAKKLEPDMGKVDVGDTVKIGLYSQETYHIDDDMRVIDYVKEGSDYITTSDGVKISASQMLEKFLFPPSVQWTPIGKLSGGEKRRLHLLRVLMEAPNVLLLDEPTNDLDIETLTILEDYLEEFSGAVVVVSHDRYFLDKVVDKVFVFEGDGKIVQYTGNYWSFKQNVKDKKQEINKETKKVPKKEKPSIENKPLKLSYKEQREYEEIDEIILELEDKIREIDEKIEGASTDYLLLQELLEEKDNLNSELDKKMERWVYLNELVEKIEEQKN